jgi:hypothetical protein
MLSNSTQSNILAQGLDPILILVKGTIWVGSTMTLPNVYEFTSKIVKNYQLDCT